jgi:hypothetical protein
MRETVQRWRAKTGFDMDRRQWPSGPRQRHTDTETVTLPLTIPYVSGKNSTDGVGEAGR